MKKLKPFFHHLLASLPVMILLSGSIMAQAPDLPSSPQTWSIVATYTIPGKASGLAFDGTYLYFGIYGASGSDVYKFNPADGTSTLQCTGPFDDAFGMTYKAPNLVTIKQPSSSSQPALALEFNMSGSQVSTITLPDHYMSGIAYDNDSYWVCTYYNDPGKVYHINSSGAVISQFVPPANQPWDICLQGSDLWIADYWADMLYKVTTSGTVIESHASQISDPAGIVYDGTYLWYCAGPLGGSSTLYKIDLQGSGTPVITLPVTTHDFGTVTTGTYVTWNCQVQNTGTANLVLNSLGVNAGIPVSTTQTFPATITPGGSLNLPILYSPIVPGALNTDVTINSNDPVLPAATLHLTGNAVVNGPHINITQTSHNWGDRRRGAYSRWYLPVNNDGNTNLVISGLTFSDPAFVLDPSVTLPVTIQPLQTTNIGLWFHPAAGLPYSGTLSIASNAAGQNPFIIQLQGNGIDTYYPVGTPLWYYNITGGSDNSPKAIQPIQDITGDGIADVVISSEDNFISCFNGNSSGEADLLWATEIYSGNVYSQNGLAIIADINNDGYQDVIAATTGGDRSVRALSGKTGQFLWRYDTHAFGGGGWVYQVEAKIDFNNDGHPDVLACAGDDGNGTGPKRVFCLNGLTGIPIWICPTEGAVFGVIGVQDFNGDGKPDVVAGAIDAGQVVSRVYGINGVNGTKLWTNSPPGSSTWALLQIDDFTGDGIKDVATGDFSGHVYFHNVVTGARIKTTTVQSNALILRFQEMGDLNNDGHPDFIVGSSAAKGVIINGYDASILWQKPLVDKSWNVTNMGDITWDGINDPAIGTLYSNNRTYFLNGTNGASIEEVPCNAPVDAIDAIPDIVGDNTMELVVGNRDGGVICYSGGFDSTTIAVQGNGNLVTNAVRAYPNPCSGLLHVEVSLARTSDVNLRVTGMTGRQVYAGSFAKVNAGKHVFDLERSMFAGETSDGLYIIEVATAESVQHIKVMFR